MSISFTRINVAFSTSDKLGLENIGPISRNKAVPICFYPEVGNLLNFVYPGVRAINMVSTSLSKNDDIYYKPTPFKNQDFGIIPSATVPIVKLTTDRPKGQVEKFPPSETKEMLDENWLSNLLKAKLYNIQNRIQLNNIIIKTANKLIDSNQTVAPLDLSKDINKKCNVVYMMILNLIPSLEVNTLLPFRLKQISNLITKLKTQIRPPPEDINTLIQETLNYNTSKNNQEYLNSFEKLIRASLEVHNILNETNDRNVLLSCTKSAERKTNKEAINIEMDVGGGLEEGEIPDIE